MPGFTSLRKPQTPAPAPANLINIQDVRIASPCPADWAKMATTGDDRVRRCAECNLNVYNFAAMTVTEIEALLASRHGDRLCARIYRRVDGTMLTQDCPKGLRAVMRRVSRVAGAALSALMSVNFAAAQTSSQTPQKCPPSAPAERHDSGLALDVLDPQGALIPKAEITLARNDGKKKRKGVTGASGQWQAGNLKAIDYVLTVKAKGFKPANIPVTLTAGKVLDLQVRLHLGEVATEVVVVGETPVVSGTIIDVTSRQPFPMVGGTGGGPVPLKQ